MDFSLVLLAQNDSSAVFRCGLRLASRLVANTQNDKIYRVIKIEICKNLKNSQVFI